MIRIRKFHPRDLRRVLGVIHDTYLRCNRKESPPAVLRHFLERCDPRQRITPELRLRFRRTSFAFVAAEHGRIVGVVRGFPGRVVNLFVRPERQRRGIGAALLRRMETAYRRRRIREVRIRSSRFAVPFYQRMGYRRTTGVRRIHGLSCQPMIKKF